MREQYIAMRRDAIHIGLYSHLSVKWWFMPGSLQTTALIGIVCAGLFASDANAQELQVTPTSVNVDMRIRVVASGVTHEGRVLRTGAWLEIGTDSLPARIAASAIDSLWVHRRHGGIGALVGGLVGAAPVIAICGQELDECGLVPNGLLIIGFGAGLGYVFGSAFSSWRLVLGRAPNH